MTIATKIKLKVRGTTPATATTTPKAPAKPQNARQRQPDDFERQVKAVVDDMLDAGEISFETPAEGIVSDVRDHLDDLIPAIFEKLLAYGKTHGSNEVAS